MSRSGGRDAPRLGTITSNVVVVGPVQSAPETVPEVVAKPKQMKGLVANKMKIGSKFGKR